ncbi:hypothetical protein F01_460634 [Burkholderia cenocepacia]|nr:hypothetical protein F01_460634 [Burkholderia cenocepacia]
MCRRIGLDVRIHRDIHAGCLETFKSRLHQTVFDDAAIGHEKDRATTQPADDFPESRRGTGLDDRRPVRLKLKCVQFCSSTRSRNHGIDDDVVTPNSLA